MVLITCPIYNFGDQDDVKYALMTFGLSSKSLEGVSILVMLSVNQRKKVRGNIKDK